MMGQELSETGDAKPQSLPIAGEGFRADDRPPVVRALLEDGSLALVADADVWDAVEPWVPRIPSREPSPGDVRATLRVRSGAPTFTPPEEVPALDLRGVLGWIRPGGEILLHGPDGRTNGRVNPADGDAEVRLDPPAIGTADFGVQIFAALTLATAFLMGRLGRTLVHAGSIVAPDGRAWLLAGGTFSGKTTTCLNLIRSGWDYLADDHVVLGGAADGGVTVEGWPRRFNLDLGYAAGESQGVRSRVDPGDFGPGRWRSSAPLGGLLFPRVEAASPTVATQIRPAGALAKLLQQAPWLLADPAAARPLLALLERTARRPSFELRLGSDSYGDRERLCTTVAHAVRGAV